MNSEQNQFGSWNWYKRSTSAMIPVVLNVLIFVLACVVFIYCPLIVIMCDICFKQTYQNDSHVHIFKNIFSDHLVVVPVTAERNHDILLALSVYVNILSAAGSWQERRRQFWRFPACLKFSTSSHNIPLTVLKTSHDQSIFQNISVVATTSSGNSALSWKTAVKTDCLFMRSQ